jgi:hypothetical protein
VDLPPGQLESTHDLSGDTSRALVAEVWQAGGIVFARLLVDQAKRDLKELVEAIVDVCVH